MTVTYYDSNTDSEVSCELPSNNEVCPKCKGHGTHLTPSIGNYGYSSEEFQEAFQDPEDRAEYFRRGGKYDVTCEKCGGKNVVPVVDASVCNEQQKAHLKAWRADQKLQREAEREAAQECRIESMMLGEYEFGYSD